MSSSKKSIYLVPENLEKNCDAR